MRNRRRDPNDPQVWVSAWICLDCDVGGQDIGREPECWNCKSADVEVTAMTARPLDEVQYVRLDPSFKLRRKVYL